MNRLGPLGRWGVLLTLTWCNQAWAKGEDPQQTIEQARQLQAEGQGEEARDLLREAMEAHPDNEQLVLARAASYLADENEFWALKILQEFVQQHPPGCESRTFIARIHIDQAHLEQAEEILDRPGCDDPPEIHARVLLLRAVMAQASGDHEATRELAQQARDTTPRFEEDEALLRSLSAEYDAHRMPLLSWSLDFGAGYTSNGLANSPVDVEAPQGDTGSPITVLDASLRLVVPTGVPVRPTAEVKLKFTELLSERADIRDLSTRQPTFRLGALFGNETPRLGVNYSYDVVRVQAGDQYDPGPTLYSEAHRGEYELEAADSFYAFGGGGYRRFREAGRSRFELEQGLAAMIALSDTVSLMTGLSARFYDARNDAYDAVGATALARLNIALSHGWSLRETLSLSGDRYPNSAGYFRGSDGRDRHDTLLRAGAELWTPAFWGGFHVNLDYEYTSRDSTAAAYSFADHRTLLHVLWRSDSDQLAVSVVPVDERVPMNHGIAEVDEEAGSQTEIRDLMRQDEAVQRGSSCLK